MIWAAVKALRPPNVEGSTGFFFSDSVSESDSGFLLDSDIIKNQTFIHLKNIKFFLL